jgi:hypothetical protein
LNVFGTMNTGTIGGKRYVIVVGQCVEEVNRVDGGGAMMGLIRPETAKCEVCGRDTYITRMTIEGIGASTPIYLTCIGCAGVAVSRFSDIGPEAVQAMRQLAAAYEIALAKHVGGEG